MMVVPLSGGAIEHRAFSDLPRFLRPGDLLVLNDTRVVPARLMLTRSTGGKVEALLLPTWGEALLDSGGRLKPGEVLRLEDGSTCTLGNRRGEVWGVTFESGREIVERLGRAPLPPYIKRAPDAVDLERYQTVYAEHPRIDRGADGGLHFTRELLERINTARVTLHVGTGTFKPVRAENVEDHVMEPERYEIPDSTIRAIEEGGPRHCGGHDNVPDAGGVGSHRQDLRRNGALHPSAVRIQGRGRALTNFHLPKSTLLMLVCAFAGRDRTLEAYAEAVKEKYRFFSYGDASLWTT
jgi:S-adenosylmethionine:tRNA ribosyltransferase-isomerase